MKSKIIITILSIITILILLNYFKNISQINKNIIKNDIKEEVSEDYIIGVVACEMPALYHEEALKAQAIAARTYYAYKLENNKEITKEDQCYISKKEMQDKWKEDYTTYYNKIKKVVEDTEQLVMNKNNKLFKSFYFSTSNGYTENSITVFKEENIKSVESKWDINSKDYYRKITYTKQELENILGPFNEIKIISRNNTNHVEKVKVDDTTYTGIEFRKKLKLRSTDFKINIINNKYEIETFGYGHGVGMSQNGANELAKQGYDYRYILNYYYNNIKIVKIDV